MSGKGEIRSEDLLLRAKRGPLLTGREEGMPLPIIYYCNGKRLSLQNNDGLRVSFIKHLLPSRVFLTVAVGVE